MLNLIKSFIPSPIKNMLVQLRNMVIDPYAIKSFSQEGEDMILRRIFEGQQHGFYVDVGAHHPRRFSNTFFFYSRGWSGVNIDAMPGSMIPFNKSRARDVNIECGVGEYEGQLTYYLFNEPALNGFSRDISFDRAKRFDQYIIIDTLQIPIRPLSSILNETLPAGQDIDFMSVDVEGLDIQVLRSNDWRIYRPKYVLVEALAAKLSTIHQDPLSSFMRTVGYTVYAKCVNTIFFERNDLDRGKDVFRLPEHVIPAIHPECN